MAYALINTQTVTLDIGVWEGTGMTAKFVITSTQIAPGTVCNLIEYDGVSEYTPAEGYEVKEVPEGTTIGTNVGV